jgi:hypothetical protein
MIARHCDATFWSRSNHRLETLLCTFTGFLFLLEQPLASLPYILLLVWLVTPLRHEEGIQASSKQYALIWRQRLWWGVW